MTIPLQTQQLGKRYGNSWALRDCTLSLGSGSVTALIGPNGAGKSTLLRMAVGLAAPSEGTVSVFGRDPISNSGEVLPRIGFVAQERPLYHRFTVDEMCRAVEHLNPRWDREFALSRLRRLQIDLNRKTGKLSGGQQAQVALVLCLAKRPELIVLDEPTASLDPVARREFFQVLMDSVATDGSSVLLSSHNVADLERVCDHIVIIAGGSVRVTEEIDGFMRTHRLLVGARATSDDLSLVKGVVQESNTDRQTTLLVRANGHVYDARWDVREIGFEEIVLGYLSADRTPSDAVVESVAS